jgi:hypothetical protein
MKVNRRKFSAQQKVQILRQHLVEKVPISEIEPSTRIVSTGQTEVGSAQPCFVLALIVFPKSHKAKMVCMRRQIDL